MGGVSIGVRRWLYMAVSQNIVAHQWERPLWCDVINIWRAHFFPFCKAWWRLLLAHGNFTRGAFSRAKFAKAGQSLCCRYLNYWERRAVALLNMYGWSCTYLSKIIQQHRLNLFIAFTELIRLIDLSTRKVYTRDCIYSVIIHYRTIYNHLLFFYTIYPLSFFMALYSRFSNPCATTGRIIMFHDWSFSFPFLFGNDIPVVNRMQQHSNLNLFLWPVWLCYVTDSSGD